ncbi:splicing factor [Coemansia thaxteri]|uniref:Splicing factor n=1 Tax=Coemansia thaxteri TaxID=2663907 RepID=A0A9W8EGW9_9FUNG|nr:splicing factor [Coemansia thaxteri]KAJ2008188.1 splicing factor [Coemansia thaxteri]KAJ2472385.1 splicing factor [Coemansia sp. RSA 2322]KAJ2485540.1 splicing factor [Coemansia sp. RSA 2320]
MTDMARQLLQELMGQYQDTGKKYTDSDVCKDHLVDFCPNQQFVNTKADLGSCDLVHDDRLREEYQKSRDRGRLGYEEAFYSRLQRLSQDLQRKVKRALDRITTEGDEQLVNPHREEKEEKAIILDVRIKQALKQVEELGMSGKVDEALSIFNHTERLKSDLVVLKRRIDHVNPIFKNEKRLEVCDVCGAFLVPNDASKRLDAHKEGKQHQGYIRIQQALEGHRSSSGGGGGGHVRESRGGGDRGGDRRRYDGGGRQSRSRSPARYQDRRRGNDNERGYYDRDSSRHRDSSRRHRRDERRH